MNKPLGYVGGGIMTRGEQLARQEECDKMENARLNVNYYSPALNKSINDKSNMTEEENNHLAEKIVDADVSKLWESDFTVMCPEQSAIGTMCEVGILYGWKYLCDKIIPLYKENPDLAYNELKRIENKVNFFHYSDIRTNHLNEKDWRRSFSINQFLYGIILYASKDNKLNDNFDEVISKLIKEYGQEETE